MIAWLLRLAKLLLYCFCTQVLALRIARLTHRYLPPRSEWETSVLVGGLSGILEKKLPPATDWRSHVFPLSIYEDDGRGKSISSLRIVVVYEMRVDTPFAMFPLSSVRDVVDGGCGGE